MPGKKAPKIILSDKQKQILEGFSKGTHTPLHLKQRASIVLMASGGDSNHGIYRKLKLSYDCVAKWRSRYAAALPVLEKTEMETPLQLRGDIIATLSDATRPGAPPTFTQEQVAAILAIACDEPDKRGLPFSHWTPALLKDFVITKGIVTSISERQIQRFFKRSRPSTTPLPLLVEPRD